MIPHTWSYFRRARANVESTLDRQAARVRVFVLGAALFAALLALGVGR